jgi:putative restriction endonuclease
MSSDRIEEEFEHGRHYYALHGGRVHVPIDLARRPDPQALTWHKENRYLG